MTVSNSIVGISDMFKLNRDRRDFSDHNLTVNLQRVEPAGVLIGGTPAIYGQDSPGNE